MNITEAYIAATERTTYVIWRRGENDDGHVRDFNGIVIFSVAASRLPHRIACGKVSASLEPPIVKRLQERCYYGCCIVAQFIPQGKKKIDNQIILAH